MRAATAHFTGPPVIIYRMVPHYRRALYDGLHRRLGLRVVAPEHDEGRDAHMAPVERAPWLVRVPFVRRPGLLAAAPVDTVLADLKPRLVVAEAGLRSPTLWRLLVRRRQQLAPPILLWGHGWQMGRGFDGPLDRLSQYGRLAPFAAADGHIVYSHEGAAFVRRHLPRARLWVAPNTQDVVVDEAALARSIDATRQGDRPLTLLFCGRLTPDKKVPALIALFKKLRTVEGGARLHLVGNGPAQPDVERAAGSLWQSAIRWHGALYDEAALTTLSLKADLAISAGAVGLSVNHALGHGLPFVLFERHRHGPPFHHPEHAHVHHGETGLRVPAQQPEAMVRAIAQLAADRARLATMRRAARDHYVRSLSMRTYVDAFAYALDDALVET